MDCSYEYSSEVMLDNKIESETGHISDLVSFSFSEWAIGGHETETEIRMCMSNLRFSLVNGRNRSLFRTTAGRYTVPKLAFDFVTSRDQSNYVWSMLTLLSKNTE